MNEKLAKWVSQSKRIVFFGGAGVSTESGIPDFRSVDGLYNQQYDYPPETILSHSFFVTHTQEFYDFYRAKMLCPTAKPNKAHQKLAQLEQAGKLAGVITQNIDRLHARAGTRRLVELHGRHDRIRCSQCGTHFPRAEVAEWLDELNPGWVDAHIKDAETAPDADGSSP